jgi:hypothetical protein
MAHAAGVDVMKAIFVPVAVLALITLVVAMLVGFHRVRAGAKRRLAINDFQVGESQAVPEDVRLPNRNLMNLLELPVLFYSAAVILFVTNAVDSLYLTLAWTYVGLRILHSLVHLTYNKVPHRAAFFALSNIVLSGIWLRLAASLF